MCSKHVLLKSNIIILVFQGIMVYMQVPPLLLTRFRTPDFISKFNPFTTGYSEEKATKTLTVFKMKKKKEKKHTSF